MATEKHPTSSDIIFKSPNGKSVISPADREWVELGGLAVVEASWARLDEVPFNKIRSPHERLCMSFKRFEIRKTVHPN